MTKPKMIDYHVVLNKVCADRDWERWQGVEWLGELIERSGNTLSPSSTEMEVHRPYAAT
jgi:hypothetical protein